jgi:hypothetical protein
MMTNFKLKCSEGEAHFDPTDHNNFWGARLRNRGEWLTFMKGADWRHPCGPKSSINNLNNHPVMSRSQTREPYATSSRHTWWSYPR